MIAGLVAVGGGAGMWWLYSIGLAGDSEPRARVEVVVPGGASASQIGALLEHKGVVRSALGFRLATYLEGSEGAIQAGRYLLHRNLTARDALAALAEGPRVDFTTVTFPEGSWLTDFARILEEHTKLSGKAFLRLARSGKVRSRLQPRGVDTLEGLLWPSTYQVVADDTVRTVMGRLVAELEDKVAGLDLARVDEDGYTAYDAVVIASMVEAEAKLPQDRAKIAAVIFNRLRAEMPLGIDATVAYAVGKRHGGLTGADLAVDSPYNTRRVTGLPPTPIGAPGLASLRASAHPAAGDWLYYVVSDCKGHHAFSTSYAEFLAAKSRYQDLEC
jgi:UPF0755 protein